MPFDTIEELLKSKNATLPSDPNDPAGQNDPNGPKDDKDKVKPFGNTPIDPLTGHPIYGGGAASSGLRATIGDRYSGHRAVILKRSFEDGKVKVFEDGRGLAERTEMIVDEGKIMVYKDYDYQGGLSRYKRIDIYNINEELVGSIKLYPKDKLNPHPIYRFFYEQSEIGLGNGDIALFIAQALVARNIQSRSGAGTSLDGEIITTIKQILDTKR